MHKRMKVKADEQTEQKRVFIWLKGDGDEDLMFSVLQEILRKKGFTIICLGLSYEKTKSLSSLQLDRAYCDLFLEVAGDVPEHHLLFLGGYSRGAKTAVRMGQNLKIVKSIFFGFPFHCKHEVNAAKMLKILASYKTPMLIVQGSRDAFGNREQIKGYRLNENIELHWFEDGSHQLIPRQKSEFALDIEWQKALNAVEKFLI